MKRKISLITMGQGNVKALKKTLDSFKGVVDEVVYGDLLIFQEDRRVVESYAKAYNINIQTLPFNFIFHNGFSSCLNFLIGNAKNDMVIYMNTSEVIQQDNGINRIVDENGNCNMFYFDHQTDNHRWYRCFDKREVSWSGRIHEEPFGDERPYHKPIFRMADEEKDMDDKFKAAVFNSVKELTYFNNLIKIVGNPKLKESTNDYWINYAKEQYDSMVVRLNAKGKQYEAFKTGDFDMFLEDIYTSPYFKFAEFDSSPLAEFQGSNKSL